MATNDPALIFLPPKVYVLKQVWEKPQAARRAERVCAACSGAQIRTFTYEELPDIVVEEKWDHFPKMGTLKTVPPPIPVLCLHEFDRAKARATAEKMRAAYKGSGCFDFTIPAGDHAFLFFCSQANSPKEIRPHPQHVCRPQWRLHQGRGCPHQCAYCALGGHLIAHVNTEEYIEHMVGLLKHNPWQKTWLYDDNMDVPTLEPQLDALAPLMRFFETTGDRYLIIHTKTDRVAGFLQANAPKNTIIAWSLSGPTQSRCLEKVAGTMEGRIEAARVCQQAGITVRFKFKPIVPVPNWRQEARYMIQQVFEKTRPDNLSATVLMWMNLKDLKSCIPADLLDPEFVAAAEAAEQDLRDDCIKPFPEPMREKVYQHYFAEVRRINKQIPFCISTESLSMWKRLGPQLGYSPTDYVCGCGAGATPGRVRLASNPWQDAKKALCWDGAPAFESVEAAG